MTFTVSDVESIALARRHDPITSHEAAASVDAANLEQKVLDVIARYGEAGCISDEICAAFPKLGVQTVSPRYKQLKDKGLIEETGEKRKGKSGRAQMVLRVRRGQQAFSFPSTKKAKKADPFKLPDGMAFAVDCTITVCDGTTNICHRERGDDIAAMVRRCVAGLMAEREKRQ